MKQLEFKRTGRMLVAHSGNRRLVIHRTVLLGRVGYYVAEVYEREGGKKAPIASERFGSKAQAVEWLGRFRDQVA